MSEDRGQGPLIRVAPGQVATGLKEVQLVPVVAVSPGEDDQDDSDGSRERAERQPRLVGLRPRTIHSRGVRWHVWESGRGPHGVTGRYHALRDPLGDTLPDARI